jgi:hypothetical protein
MFLQLANDRIKAIVTQWRQLTTGCGSTRHNPEGLYLFEEMGDHIMRELEQILAGDGYAAPPSHILEGLSQEVVHQLPPRAPHSIYEELWHITFWQQITLDWIAGVETPFPASPRDGFPTVLDAEREYWKDLCQRFFAGIAQAAAAARDERWLAGTLPFASWESGARDDGTRAVGESGRAQCLSPGANRAAAATAGCVAAGIRRIHVVKRCPERVPKALAQSL